MPDEEDVVEPEAPEASEPDEPEVVERDFDGEATKQGWVPKDQFYGNPDDWRDAKEFVRRGEEVLPIVKATLGKKVSELESKLVEKEREFESRIAKQEKYNKLALDRQEQQIKNYYANARRAAVSDMDTEAYDAAEQNEHRAIENMRKQVADADVPSKTGPNISEADQRSVNDWMLENPWFNTDRVLNAAGDEAFLAVNADMPGASMSERLAEVRRRVSMDYPKKFGIKTNGQTRVEGGTRQAGGGSAGPRFNALPGEAKRAFKEFMDRGVYTEKDKEAYAKEYNDE